MKSKASNNLQFAKRKMSSQSHQPQTPISQVSEPQTETSQTSFSKNSLAFHKIYYTIEYIYIYI